MFSGINRMWKEEGHGLPEAHDVTLAPNR